LHEAQQAAYTAAMGFYDRDYMRAPGRTPVRPPWWPASITGWLIAINVGVFIFDLILGRLGFRQELLPPADGTVVERIVFTPLEYWGHFSKYLAVDRLQIWRFITFQFLHANLGHLFFNMLALYFFGPMVESYLSSRRFLPFYLLSGIGGVALYLVLLGAGFRGIGNARVPLVGASAGIFGVLIAAAQIAPYARVLVMGVVPMSLKAMAWLFIAVAAVTVLQAGPNAGGEAAHLGGAAVGFVLMRWPGALTLVSGPQRRRGSW
jgi:membrane associated rhomboid family serine protease